MCLPADFDDLPALAVEDGLDAVDAAIGGLFVAANSGLAGTPEVGDVGPGLCLDRELVLGEDLRAKGAESGRQNQCESKPVFIV